MPDFVAKVTKQRSVRFAHFGPAPFTLRIVSLFQGDGDQAIVMAGRTFGPVGLGLSARKSKAEALLRVVDPGHQRQPQPLQCIEQPMLVELE